jgi:quinol monooxygenase YgiN
MLVFFYIKPGFEAEYENLVAPVLDAMRHEPTFIDTVLHRDPEDPTRFMLYETWLDRHDFFQVQLKRGYRRTYEERVPQISQAPRQICFLGTVTE